MLDVLHDGTATLVCRGGLGLRLAGLDADSVGAQLEFPPTKVLGAFVFDWPPDADRA
jgi:hypothetical protein